MTDIEFIDQTLRDGQQSLWGLRMRAYHAAGALPHIDRTGFQVVDLTGAGMFTVLLRLLGDDPWATTDFMIKNLPRSTTRSAIRTLCIIGFGFTPDSVIDLWTQTLAKHGIGSFWLFDCLYDMAVMERAARVVHDAGAVPVPAIMYGLTGVHDDAFFAERARQMATWPGVTSIYVEDAAGVLKPERARTLLPAIRAATGTMPLEIHCHNTTGLAQHNYIEAMKAGFTVLHTASRPMANGPSLPSTEAMVPIVEHMGFRHRLDTTQFAPVEENFIWAAKDAGYPLGRMVEYDPRIYDHQLPGGMTGTLKNQLALNGLSHRWDDVLAEIPRVRAELGSPIMATPFSQFVGIQSVLNIVTPERYSLVPDEVIQYAMGHFGPVPSPIHPDVLDRIMAAPRAAALAGWTRPQPTLKEIRAQFPSGTSDEELLLRYMTSNEEVDTMLRAGPIRTDPRRSSSSILASITELVAEAKGSRPVSVRNEHFAVRLGSPVSAGLGER